jgi:hypothetical protein
MWVQAYVVGVAPGVGLTRQFVGDEELGAVGETEGGQVQVDGGLTDLVRVQIDHGQDHVVADALGEAQEFRLVRMVEP